MKFFFGFALATMLLILTGCAEDSAPSRPIDFLPLTDLTIESQYPQIANLTTNQFSAKGDFSGRFTEDVTDRALWSVDNPEVLQIDANTGFATALTPGTVTVTATIDDVSAELEFTVSDAVIVRMDVEPAVASLPLGLTRPFTANATFSDETTQDLTRLATWTSGDSQIAVVDETGIARGVAVGTTNIEATFQETTGQSTLVVTGAILEALTIEPGELNIAPSDTFQLSAKGFFSDDTTLDITQQAQWSSSAESIATVSTTGLLTAVAPGEANITATRNSRTFTITVTVATLQEIAISVEEGAVPSVAQGQTLQLVATGHFSGGLTFNITNQVEWSIVPPAGNATISNQDGERGIVTGLFPGAATVRAVRNSVSNTFNITVTP